MLGLLKTKIDGPRSSPSTAAPALQGDDFEPAAELDNETSGTVPPLETPPLTPASDGEKGSTEGPSIKEPTAKKDSKMQANIAELCALLLNEPEISSDESEGSETESGSESLEYCPRSDFNYKLYWTWFLFWLVALAGGLLAFHSNSNLMAHGPRNKEMNLLLMPREKWDDSTYVVDNPTVFVAERVIVVQTETERCDNAKACSKLLNAMKRQQGYIKYNFLLSTDGCIYEGLGWQEPSPLYRDDHTMVVAFIGTYDDVAPSVMQLTQLESLLEASQDLKYLTKSYTLLGKKVNTIPSKLFAYLSGFKHWDKANSDTDDRYPDVDYAVFALFYD